MKSTKMFCLGVLMVMCLVGGVSAMSHADDGMMMKNDAMTNQDNSAMNYDNGAMK